MVKERQPISFRPSRQDVEAMAAIRSAYKWITSDADTIRAALALSLEVLQSMRLVKEEAVDRVVRAGRKGAMRSRAR